MQKVLQAIKSHKWISILSIIIIIGVIIGIIVLMNNTQKTTKYVTYTVAKGNIQKTVSLSGNIQAARVQNGNFSISSTSTVTEIDVKAGDMVKPGQILAKIDTADLQNKFTQAESSYNQAKNDYTNMQLKGGKSQTYIDFNNANEKIKAALSNYNIAKSNLDQANLKAEFAGQVVSISMVIGDAAGTNTIVVIDPNSFYIQASLSEYDLTKLQSDMTASITFDNLDSKTYIGKLGDISLSPDISSNVVSYKAKVTLVANDGQLKLGYTGKAVITLASKDDVLTVPTAAIKSRAGSSYVQVMNNGVISEKDIELGLVGDTQTEISSGLNEGDVVVVSINTTASTSTTQQTGGAFQIGGGAGGAGGGNRTFTRN